MQNNLLETLPLPQRLALTYAPAAARSATLGLLVLDARLGQVIAQASEPLTAQLRLAWWRDVFAAAPETWPKGEHLLAALAPWQADAAALGQLVDGWEELLAEQLDEAAARRFVAARGAAFGSLAGLLGCPEEPASAAGESWAWGDLAARLGQPDERAMALRCGLVQSASTIRLPRGMRPLTVLHGLARRSLRRGGAGLLSGPGATFAAIRLGLFGR